MNKYQQLFLVATFLVSVAFAAQSNFNSEPVSWSDVRDEGPKLVLEGTFSITLPNGGRWKKKGSAIGPSGSPINFWDCVAPDGKGTGLFVVMDVAIDKVPESERDDFTSTLANAFRRTGIEAMQRRGYTLEHFKIEPFESKWPRSVRAISRFAKDGENQVNITYFIPAGRIYIFGYEGALDDEAPWFISARTSLECR